MVSHVLRSVICLHCILSIVMVILVYRLVCSFRLSNPMRSCGGFGRFQWTGALAEIQRCPPLNLTFVRVGIQVFDLEFSCRYSREECLTYWVRRSPSWLDHMKQCYLAQRLMYWWFILLVTIAIQYILLIRCCFSMRVLLYPIISSHFHQRTLDVYNSFQLQMANLVQWNVYRSWKKLERNLFRLMVDLSRWILSHPSQKKLPMHMKGHFTMLFDFHILQM